MGTRAVKLASDNKGTIEVSYKAIICLQKKWNFAHKVYGLFYVIFMVHSLPFLELDSPSPFLLALHNQDILQMCSFSSNVK